MFAAAWNLLPSPVASLHSMTRIARWIRPLLLLGLLSALRGIAGTVDLVPSSASWRWRPGTNEASLPDVALWRSVGFDDSSWNAPGPLPIFYGEPLAGTLVEGMQFTYSSLFVRTAFNVADPGAYSQLTLRAECDDGFIAWVNGHEIARYNVPDGDLAFDRFANGAVPEPIAFGDYPVGVPASVLQAGANVVAVQVFNVALTSSDIVWAGSLDAVVDTEPPTVVQTYPQTGQPLVELSSFEVVFSEPVNGVDASDLLVNGVPATSVSETVAGQFLFSFPAVPTGTATLAFRPDHGIADKSPAAHPFAGGSWTFQVDPSAVPPAFVINEFLADNQHGIRDEDGKRSDWIEIRNTGTAAASLAGWTLTDDAKNPAKWIFPKLAVPGKGFVVVWASGNDRTNPAAPLHTNFKLGTGGGYLALVAPGGVVSTGFAPSYPPQRADNSYGQVTGGAGFAFFPKPTPGAQNSIGGPGFAPDLQLLPAGRTYLETMDVTLAFATNAPPPPGAEIRFTTDHALPTASSPLYTGVIHLTNSAVELRARAFAPGLLPGAPRTEMYLPLAVNTAAFHSDIPVMIIHDFNRGRPPAGTRIPSYFQVFEPDASGVTSFTNPPTLAARAGISVRGSSTQGLPKASLRVEFLDDFEASLDVPPLGLPAANDWILYGSDIFEPVLIHNPYMYQLSRDIGRYAPRTKLCEVYLVVTGTNGVGQASYNGVYVLEERIQTGKNRVDLGNLEPQNLTKPTVTGGYMMKVDRLAPGDSGIPAGNITVAMVDPKEAELRDPARAPQYAYLTDYLNRFTTTLYRPEYADPDTGYRQFVETGSWVDHHLLNVLAFNVDALRLSAYFGKRRDGKLEFGPLWDFDRSLGSTDGRDSNPRVWRSASGDGGTDFFNFTWWDRMFTDAEFWQQYIDRYQELRRDAFSVTNLNRLVDDLGNQARKAAVRDWARWGASPRTSTYQGELNLMKNWLANRVAFMDGQFVPPPILPTPPGVVVAGALVTLTRPGAAPGLPVYYTLDGTDPRLSGNSISPKAKLYAAPFAITTNSRVVARTRDPGHKSLTGQNNPPLGSTWSGPVAATYVVTPPPIACTEIMFNPTDGPGGSAGDFEFIELRNTGDAPYTLNGCSVGGGVTFAFPATNPPVRLAAGARLVLVASLDAFTNRYPGVTNIGGVFSGNLANEGDRIVFLGPLRETAFDFRYDPAWLPAAANGHSLVPVGETGALDPSLGTSWRASAVEFGSPGRLDAASLPTAPALSASVDVDGHVAFEFTLPAGRAVELQSTDALSAPAWNFVQTFPATGGERTEHVPVDPTATARFYRLANRVP